MIRVLSMIALAGFFLSVVCISAALALGGPDLLTDAAWGWTGRGVDVHWSHDRDYSGVGWSREAHADRDEASATREIAWTGGDALQIDIPADVSVTQSDAPAKLVVRGPRSAVDHVALNGDALTWNGTAYDANELTIEVRAPAITHFSVNSSGKLAIHNFKADTLDLRVMSSGDVSADGAAKDARLDVMSSGDADLSGLAAEAAEVRLAGSGHATVQAKRSANLEVTGSGDVRLIGRPSRLETRVTGSGHIETDERAGEPA